MKNSTLILKPFGDYEVHEQVAGNVVSTFKKRVILGKFDIHGMAVHVPHPVFDYPWNMLATPYIGMDGDHLVVRFDQWRLFDMVMDRYLPITLNLSHPGCEEAVILVDRYVRHARELDDDQLAKWIPEAAAQLGVKT